MKSAILYTNLLALALFLCSCASARNHITERVVYYTSIDQHGDTLTLSGKVSVPSRPKGVILMPHFTIASNSEVPSTGGTGEERYLRNDYILIMPDYIGYGASVHRVHPYLRGDLTARNCVDMLFAAQPVLDSIAQSVRPNQKLSDDSKPSSLSASVYSIDTLSIVGFSQGGATALWILKLLEEEYADRIFVKACYAGSGPYDVAATYDVAVANNEIGMPMVIPMLVMGTSEAYDLHLKREDFFTPELNEHYDDYITSKSHKFTELYFKMLNHNVSHWLTAQGADKTQPETRRLYEGLLRSSLVHYPLDDSPVGREVICPGTGYTTISEAGCCWRPKTPVYVMHSYDDGIVTFHCAEHLQRCWQNMPNVTFDFGHYGGHMRSNITFFSRVIKLLQSNTAKP